MDSTEALWADLDPMAPALDAASILIGIDRRTIEVARRVEAVTSADAGVVLASMKRLDRILTSAQRVRSEVCVHSVRGPIAWSETMTARANALGNEDVFVCKTSERSLDTVGNRLVVDCLTTIAEADPFSAEMIARAFNTDDQDLVRVRAAEAREWLEMVVMSRIPRKAPSRRELTKLRAGRRAREFDGLIGFFECYNSRPTGSLLSGLADPQTAVLHTFVTETVAVLRRHGSIPTVWTVTKGRLTAGPLGFRHPGRPGPGAPGLSFRGIPLLPPRHLVTGAAWSGELPAHGETVMIDQDVVDVLSRMGLARA